MLRIIIENILLLLLPTALYLTYIYVTHKPGEKRNRAINEAPLILLFLAGIGAVVLVLALFGTAGDGRPGDVYQPPVYRDGEIVPGGFKKSD
jgi:hypothetical protein